MDQKLPFRFYQCCKTPLNFVADCEGSEKDYQERSVGSNYRRRSNALHSVREEFSRAGIYPATAGLRREQQVSSCQPLGHYIYGCLRHWSAWWQCRSWMGTRDFSCRCKKWIQDWACSLLAMLCAYIDSLAAVVVYLLPPNDGKISLFISGEGGHESHLPPERKTVRDNSAICRS